MFLLRYKVALGAAISQQRTQDERASHEGKFHD
jgi:hypothetical protein